MDASDEFYIYLYSESNKDAYKYNKGSLFTNVINPPLRLTDSYTVAVENVIFKPRIINIAKNDQEYKIELFFRIPGSDPNTEEVLKVDYVPTTHIIGEAFQDIVALIADDFKQYLKFTHGITSRVNVFFSFDNVQQRVRFTPFNVDINSSDGKTYPKRMDVTWIFFSKNVPCTWNIKSCTNNTIPSL